MALVTCGYYKYNSTAIGSCAPQYSLVVGTHLMPWSRFWQLSRRFDFYPLPRAQVQHLDGVLCYYGKTRWNAHQNKTTPLPSTLYLVLGTNTILTFLCRESGHPFHGFLNVTVPGDDIQKRGYLIKLDHGWWERGALLYSTRTKDAKASMETCVFLSTLVDWRWGPKIPAIEGRHSYMLDQQLRHYEPNSLPSTDSSVIPGGGCDHLSLLVSSNHKSLKRTLEERKPPNSTRVLGALTATVWCQRGAGDIPDVLTFCQ